MTLVDGLSRPQMVVLSQVTDRLRRYRPTAIPALHDADVRDAAAAMAATLETAARGIVYEHQTPSLPAQRLLSLFRQLQSDIESRLPVPPAALAAVFRRVERACRDAAATVGGAEAAWLDFVDRVAAGAQEGPPERADGPSSETNPADPPRIIVPGA